MIDPDKMQEVKSLGLPQPDQIGFVFQDIDAAVKRYESVFGPFRTVDFGALEASYRGAAPTPFELKFAFGSIGVLEIEFIEWVAGDTPHRDFIQSGQEGVQHLRFRVDDIALWIAKVEEVGFTPYWHGRSGTDVEFTYCERAGDSLLLEFLQAPPTAFLG